MIETVKPFVVAVVDPNIGVKAAPNNELCEMLAVPLAYPDLFVVIVTVANVSGSTPVTVTSPVSVLRTAEPVGEDATVHV